jgi:nickel-dependent lactate racemase
MSANSQVTTIILDALLKSLEAIGVSPDSVKVLRTQDAPELEQTSLAAGIVTHDPFSNSNVALEDAKTTFRPSLNAAFARADLQILVGQLKPNPFLGFCGLTDIAFPGLASFDAARSQIANRKDVEAKNLSLERIQIATSLEDLFAVGFVLDADRTPAKVSFGKLRICVEHLQNTLQTIAARTIDRTADIVVLSVGGRPMDETLVRAVESFDAALPALKREGVMIIAAECHSGHGGSDFYEWCAEKKEPRYLEARLKHNFSYEGLKACFLLRTLQNHRIYLVSTIPDHYVDGVFGLRPASTVNSALQTVQRSLGSDSTISVIPDASNVSPIRSQPVDS